MKSILSIFLFIFLLFPLTANADEQQWGDSSLVRKGLMPLGLASGLGLVTGSVTYISTLDPSYALKIGTGTTLGSLVLANAILPMNKDSWLLGDIYKSLKILSKNTFEKISCKKSIKKIAEK